MKEKETFKQHEKTKIQITRINLKRGSDKLRDKITKVFFETITHNTISFTPKIKSQITRKEEGFNVIEKEEKYPTIRELHPKIHQIQDILDNSNICEVNTSFSQVVNEKGTFNFLSFSDFKSMDFEAISIDEIKPYP